ncbi:hypothetical protein BA895_15280 [Humibacillus sp. DSM 29435]|nr:hypothetical protein BA895_15280 [Humibacillus sp. DSM 29435]
MDAVLVRRSRSGGRLTRRARLGGSGSRGADSAETASDPVCEAMMEGGDGHASRVGDVAVVRG